MAGGTDSVGSTLAGITDLLGGLFGTGGKTINGSGTSNSQTASVSNTSQNTASASGEVEGTSSSTTGSTTGQQSSTGTTNQNTNTSGTSNTTGSQTSNNTSTTTGTADAGALQTARDITSKALAAMTDQGAISDLINSSLNKASVAFAPTRNAQRGAGLYNGATGTLLTGYAEGQATSDAVASVLQYQQNEQQIATSANASILEATKGTTTSGSSTTNNNSSTSSDTTANQTSNSTGSQTSSGTSQSDTDSVTSRILQSLQSIIGSSNSNVTNDTKQTSDQQQDSSGILSSVICTEMKVQGKLDQELYEIGTRHFVRTYSSDAMKAYWMWAKPTVRYMQEHPSSKLTGLISKVFNARAKHVGWKAKKSQYNLFNHSAYNIVTCTCMVVGLVMILMPRYLAWLTSVSEEYKSHG